MLPGTVWDDRASVLSAMRDGIKDVALDLINVTTTPVDAITGPLAAYGRGAVTEYLHKRGLVHTPADVGCVRNWRNGTRDVRGHLGFFAV